MPAATDTSDAGINKLLQQQLHQLLEQHLNVGINK
jgi:hypothetical protein